MNFQNFGFVANARKRYDDTIFVLVISKQIKDLLLFLLRSNCNALIFVYISELYPTVAECMFKSDTNF